jgi:SAM-dependent methyltransferase
MPQSTSKKYPWDVIFAKDGRVFTELLPIFHEAALKFSENQTRNILDLGCGNGRHVIAFQQLGYDVVGFDRSPIGLRITQEWLDEEGQTASLVEGDGRYALPFQTAVFDGLISTQVIHHALLSEIRQTISEIWRVMATGGLAVISVAGRTHQDTAYEEIEPGTFVPLDGSEAGLPHHIFTEDELRQEFSTFKIQEISYRDNGRVLVIWINKT